MSSSYDVLVIGGGPGGYVAAIRAAQLGFAVACVDAFKNPAGEPSLGGTCLNVGCIPSKALLESSEHYARARNQLGAHGIAFQGLSVDIGQMQARKACIVAKLAKGVSQLLRKHKIASLHGRGRLLARDGEDWQVEIREGEQCTVVSARQVILATGSRPRALPGVSVDNVQILDNAGALALEAVPATLGVIGAGVIGLELGSVWRRLGAEVTLLEAAPDFLAAADRGVAREALRLLTREQGLQIELGVKLGSVKAGRKGVKVCWQDAQGEERSATFDKLLVCVGREPNTDGLLAEGLALECDDRGAIRVDAAGRTSLPGVWAIGDVTPGPMLAHRASEEGVAVAERLAGQQPGHEAALMPWVMYTHPELAWVGQTEQALQAAGIDYRKGQFSFAANGRALALGEANGFVKVLACARTDRVLGVHIIGPWASELIAEAALAMAFQASSEDIARIVHAHPSLAEALHEAALGCDQRALHA